MSIEAKKTALLASKADKTALLEQGSLTCKPPAIQEQTG
jgi:hypothetical protein